MADELPLLNLFDAVVERFTTDGTQADNLFGWSKVPTKTVSSDRIIWTPGDPTGALGNVAAPMRVGENPRALASLGELFTVEIIAHNSSDAAKHESHREQYRKVRVLFDQWYRAVHLAAYGTFWIVSSKWVRNPTERVHGAHLQVVAAIRAKIPDAVKQAASVDVRASIDVHELNVTQNLTVPEEEPEDDSEDEEGEEETP